MFGRKVEDMRMTWIAQEGPALHTMAQVLGYQGPLAPLRHHTADVKAPGGVEQGHSVFEFNTDESQCLCWLGCEPAASRRYIGFACPP
jgi:hypothetical protein